MNYINGVYSILYIKHNSVYLPIGCLTSNSFSENTEMINTTVRTNPNGWTSSRPVSQSYNINFSALVTDREEDDGIITYYQIQQKKRNRELIEWKITSPKAYNDYGKGYIKDISESSEIDDFISFNASIVGQGELSTDLASELGLQQPTQYTL